VNWQSRNWFRTTESAGIVATQWFFQDGGQEQGPVAFRDLIERVRAGTLTEVDLVRSSWTADWQRADSVVGLFHMAGKTEEDLARAEPPAIVSEPALVEPIDVLPGRDIEERPSWMKRLFEVGTLGKSRPAEITVLGPAAVEQREAERAATPTVAAITGSTPAAGAPREALNPELAEDAVPAKSIISDWSSTVSAALERADGRTNKPARAGRSPRLISIVDRAARLFAPVARFGRTAAIRPVFRIFCAFACANLVAFAIEVWSNQEALRFPSRDLNSPSLRPFPFVGPCGTGEYVFLVFNLMLVSGAAAYFAAAWLESRAE
jgi:hypothetical protein